MEGMLPNPTLLNLSSKASASGQNHSTQDSRVVPHHGTDWAALWLTAQIGRDAVLSESYGRGYWLHQFAPLDLFSESVLDRSVRTY